MFSSTDFLLGGGILVERWLSISCETSFGRAQPGCGPTFWRRTFDRSRGASRSVPPLQLSELPPGSRARAGRGGRGAGLRPRADPHGEPPSAKPPDLSDPSDPSDLLAADRLPPLRHFPADLRNHLPAITTCLIPPASVCKRAIIQTLTRLSDQLLCDKAKMRSHRCCVLPWCSASTASAGSQRPAKFKPRRRQRACVRGRFRAPARLAERDERERARTLFVLPILIIPIIIIMIIYRLPYFPEP